MTVRDLIGELGLEVLTGETGLDREVTGGYASDLLSDVLGHGRIGNIWVTLQIHENVAAVAGMVDLAGIILVNSRRPEAETLDKAVSEGVPIMVSNLSAFDLVGRLHAVGVSGSK